MATPWLVGQERRGRYYEGHRWLGALGWELRSGTCGSDQDGRILQLGNQAGNSSASSATSSSPSGNGQRRCPRIGMAIGSLLLRAAVPLPVALDRIDRSQAQLTDVRFSLHCPHKITTRVSILTRPRDRARHAISLADRP